MIKIAHCVQSVPNTVGEISEIILCKQGTAVPTRAFLVGKHPNPLNNFRKIGCTPGGVCNVCIFSAMIRLDKPLTH